MKESRFLQTVPWLVGLVAGLVAVGLSSTAQAEGDLFPFVVAYGDRPNITDVSRWLHRPAGKFGHVRAQGDRLVTDAGPIRFWGTNLCFEACFPSRQEAERLAKRLASFGFNVVRLHHMDSYSIWGKSPNKTIIDPEKLDQLDYLIYQLKENGIYVNINLHVSRWLDDKEGFPHRDKRPQYDKGLGNFEPRMIELQKKYARDLLLHRNPYTGLTYAEDPAVAFVEISNEDALYTVWNWGDLDDLPDPYATTFRKLWNDWLKKKYGTTDALRAAWKAGEFPLGEELLAGGKFGPDYEKFWRLERDSQTLVEIRRLPTGPQGAAALQIRVERMGEVPWRPQIAHPGIAVKQGMPYTLQGFVRADKPGSITVNCMMAHEPWENLGLASPIPVDREWRSFQLTFFAEKDDPNARITITSLQPGTYELALFSLRPGGVIGLKAGERLEDDSVPVPRRRGPVIPEQARADFADFMWDVERAYWVGMFRFLKEELGVKALVAGTQLGYGPTHIQAQLDYLDDHAYWQHPAFPGRPWDPENWYVRNIAMVNNPGGTLTTLASRRVVGRVYTLSEYNHPAPLFYAAEGFPMVAAFGAFQGWGGIYVFCYSHSRDFEIRRLQGYFDIKSDPTRLVHMPACAAMFLRGDVKPAEKLLAAPLSPEKEREILRKTLNSRRLTTDDVGLPSRWGLVHAIGVDVKGSQAGEPPQGLPPQQVFRSDTGEIVWDVSQEGAGFFIVNTSRTKVFTGFIGGRTFDLGEVGLQLEKTRLDWGTVSLTVIEGDDFLGPARILLAATGYVQNSGAKLEELGGQRITLRRNWGTEPVLCEGIAGRIKLPVPAEQVRAWALDERGNRKAEVRVSRPMIRGAKVCAVEIHPSYQTLWYEIEIGAASSR
ncbi:MAG: cellulase family glycosylhydrolase [Thermoguttaceae bacterium]|nr:cellulase family glycosylhydrolase [Thermoguttaceae bacterium]MDW8078302.1 cellulase family glycosylhydrolase [Thermoguttaceae bacterium]